MPSIYNLGRTIISFERWNHYWACFLTINKKMSQIWRWQYKVYISNRCLNGLISRHFIYILNILIINLVSIKYVLLDNMIFKRSIWYSDSRTIFLLLSFREMISIHYFFLDISIRVKLVLWYDKLMYKCFTQITPYFFDPRLFVLEKENICFVTCDFH